MTTETHETATDKQNNDIKDDGNDGNVLSNGDEVVVTVVSIENDENLKHRCTGKTKLYALIVCFMTTISILFLAFYIFAYYEIKAAMMGSSASPVYMFSDFQNDSVTLRVIQNSTYNTPIQATLLPSRLDYGTPAGSFGYFDSPAVLIKPKIPTLSDFTDKFTITDVDLLTSFGHDILQTLSSNTSKTYTVVISSMIIVKSLIFIHWNINYESRFDFTIGSLSSLNSGVGNSSSAPLPFKVLSWQLKPFGFQIICEYDNPLPISINFGDIDAKVQINDNPLTTAVVNNYTLSLNDNTATIDFQSIHFWRMIGYALGIRPASNSILSISDLTISNSGAQVEWLNGWFQGIVFSLPQLKIL